MYQKLMLHLQFLAMEMPLETSGRKYKQHFTLFYQDMRLQLLALCLLTQLGTSLSVQQGREKEDEGELQVAVRSHRIKRGGGGKLFHKSSSDLAPQ